MFRDVTSTSRHVNWSVQVVFVYFIQPTVIRTLQNYLYNETAHTHTKREGFQLLFIMLLSR